MNGLVSALTLLVLAVVIVVLAVRLRRTPELGSAEPGEPAGSHISLSSTITRASASMPSELPPGRPPGTPSGESPRTG